ncbi:MAG: hypothetical protein LBC41_01370 [Clostridiales bacterium]|jgi:collagenase-like PrtC family protease|nr:hypothetical protein [Clostridiales bacterium]MDR2749284.1 hypothetical protein [Clostridiales bacterium]
MGTSYRIDSVSQLEQTLEQFPDMDCVVAGHESCPVFYMQQNVDEIAKRALDKKIGVKINIPIVFEEYLDFFKGEAARLLEEHQQIKLVANDWGMLYHLHSQHPKRKFAIGLGMSFSYADCPWNFHIVEGELDKYKEMLLVHNLASTKALEIVKGLGADEIIMGNMKSLEASYRIIQSCGLKVTVNRGVNIVTISRACHTLRILGKTSEKGNCAAYCKNRTILKGTHYYDMSLGIHAAISEETKAIQPEMHSYSNMLFTSGEQEGIDHSNVADVINDYRI